VFSHGAWFWVHCQSRVSGWVAGLSGGWFHVPAPGLPEIAFYYALLFGWSVGWLNRRRLAAACLAAGLLLCVRLERSRGGEITVLGGESNAIWCDLPGSRDDLLIDCGRKEGVERVLIPYLELRGVRRLPRLLLTHGAAAHVEGFSLVHDRFEPEQVMMGPVEQRSPVYRAIRAGVSGPVWVRRGDSIGAWRVLHPTDGTGVATADDVAVTLIGEWDGVRVLVMPDASRRAQREMLESRAGLKANVLILGCPRDGETVLDEFLKRVEPKVVVVKDNRIPAYDRDGGEQVRRLRALTGRVYTVSREGSVTVRLRVGGLEVSVLTR